MVVIKPEQTMEVLIFAVLPTLLVFVCICMFQSCSRDEGESEEQIAKRMVKEVEEQKKLVQEQKEKMEDQRRQLQRQQQRLDEQERQLRLQRELIRLHEEQELRRSRVSPPPSYWQAVGDIV